MINRSRTFIPSAVLVFVIHGRHGDVVDQVVDGKGQKVKGDVSCRGFAQEMQNRSKEQWTKVISRELDERKLWMMGITKWRC
jgi:hypothetical protein